MPRDFKTFAKERASSTANEKIVEENKTKANEYEQIINKYKNMNQSDLMSNLFTEASKLKKEGKLNSSSLNSLKTSLSPFLNSEQQDLLNSLVKAIDEQK